MKEEFTKDNSNLSNLSSLRGDCRDAALDPLYWISYKSGRYIITNTSTIIYRYMDVCTYICTYTLSTE